MLRSGGQPVPEVGTQDEIPISNRQAPELLGGGPKRDFWLELETLQKLADADASGQENAATDAVAHGHHSAATLDVT